MKCPVFNVPFEVGSYDYSPSLDKIIPSLGYTKGNVVVVSTKANRMKNDASLNEMRQLLKFYETVITQLT